MCVSYSSGPVKVYQDSKDCISTGHGQRPKEESGGKECKRNINTISLCQSRDAQLSFSRR